MTTTAVSSVVQRIVRTTEVRWIVALRIVRTVVTSEVIVVAVQALPAALEALHLHAALVATRTLEAVRMVHVPLEVVHTLVALTAAWALTQEALTTLEVLTLVEVTLEDVDN